jgi:hypothetical protein
VRIGASARSRRVASHHRHYVEAVRQYNAAIRIDLPEAQLLPGAAERSPWH